MFFWALTGGLAVAFAVSAPLFYFECESWGCFVWLVVYLASGLFISVMLFGPETLAPPKPFTLVYAFVVGITTGAAVSLPFLWWVERATWSVGWGCALWVIGGIIGFFWAVIVADPTVIPEPPQQDND